MITNYGSSWLLGKLSLSVPKRMHRDQYREYAYTNVSLWRFKENKRTEEQENNLKTISYEALLYCDMSSVFCTKKKPKNAV